jgi:hypothetical protein
LIDKEIIGEIIFIIVVLVAVNWIIVDVLVGEIEFCKSVANNMIESKDKSEKLEYCSSLNYWFGIIPIDIIGVVFLYLVKKGFIRDSS